MRGLWFVHFRCFLSNTLYDCQTLCCSAFLQAVLFVSLFCTGPHFDSFKLFFLSRFDLQERSNIIVLQGVGVLNMHDEDMFYPHDITHRDGPGPMVRVSLVQRLNIGYHGDASPLYRTNCSQKKKEKGKQEYWPECSQLDSTSTCVYILFVIATLKFGRL